jgi:PAS domain S-box-containing protein
VANTPRRAPAPPATTPEAAIDGVPRLDSSTVTDPWVGRIAASEGMFVTDDRQRIVAWSSAAQRLLGFSPEEAVGRTCYQMVMGREPDGHPVCGRNCSVTRNARRLRGTASYEVVAHARDGAAKCLANTVLVIEGPEGAFHVVHLLRETPMAAPVTRRVAVEPRAEEPLVESLTRRELEVLRLLGQGATIDEIADSLTISVLTARNHSANIARKLGAHSRLETVLLAMRHGLV